MYMMAIYEWMYIYIYINWASAPPKDIRTDEQLANELLRRFDGAAGLAITRVLLSLEDAAKASATKFLSQLTTPGGGSVELTRYMSWCHHSIKQNDALLGVLAPRDPWSTNSHTTGPMAEFYDMLVGYSRRISAAVRFQTEATGMRVILSALGEKTDSYLRPEKCSGAMKRMLKKCYTEVSNKGKEGTAKFAYKVGPPRI